MQTVRAGHPAANSSLCLEGYRAAVADAGLAWDDNLIIYTDKFGREAGRLGVGNAPSVGLEFDAIFCFTDLLAFGALRALADAGMTTPDDVGLVSIDDIEEAAYSVPSRTTIAPDKDAIVDGAVTAL